MVNIMTKRKISQIKEKVESEFLNLFVHKAYIHYIENPIFNDGVLKPLTSIPFILRIKSTQEAFCLVRPTYQLFGKPVFKLIRGYPISVQETYAQLDKELHIPIIENIDKTKLLEMVDKVFKYKDSSKILEIDDFRDKKKTNQLTKSIERKDLDNNDFDDTIIIENIHDKPYLKTHILEKRFLEISMNSFELETWIQTTYNKALLKVKSIDTMILLIIFLTNACTFLASWLIAQNFFKGVG